MTVAGWLQEQALLAENHKKEQKRARRARYMREQRKKRTAEQRAVFYQKVVRVWKRGRGKLAVNLRNRIHKITKRVGAPRFGTPTDLLGCKIEEARAHLSAQFKPGMSWENYGAAWDIDHIRPCSKFNLFDQLQQNACFHFSNLQPLWKSDHKRKSELDGVFSKRRISHP